MPGLRDIKRRIKSVKNTKKTTRAMKMVSAAKLRRAQEEIWAARPYARKMMEVLSSLAARTRPEAHPLLVKREVKRVELLIITSDRGMCGGFNSNIIKKAEGFIEENRGLDVTLNLIGRRVRDHFRRRGMVMRVERPMGLGRPTYPWAAEIGKELVDAYIKEVFDEIYLVYSEFRSALSQRPTIERLLPIIPLEVEGFSSEYIFEPSEDAILSQLLPKHIEVQVFRALLESSASEHGARMTAMDSATRSASDLIDFLTLKYNKVRQATITKELMEIIGGAETLKG